MANKKKDNDMMMIISIIGIVAIVGIVALTMSGERKSNADEFPVQELLTEENIAGMGSYSSYGYNPAAMQNNSNSTKIITNVTTLNGYGVMLFKSWTDTSYGNDYCQIVQGCNYSISFDRVQDGLRSCFCDEKHGCNSTNYCRNTNTGSWWYRIENITCGSCSQ